MAERNLLCWSCGAALSGIPLPLGRREQCPRCTASLHACRQCVHFDPVANKACREPVADEVVDKEGGNFCDYFLPRFGMERVADTEAARARARLAQAFGGGQGVPGAPAAPGGAAGGHTGAAGGAGPVSGPRGSTSGADEAKRRLEELFGKKK